MKGSLSFLMSKIAIIGIATGVLVMLLAVAIVNGFQSEIPAKFIVFRGEIQVIPYQLSDNPEATPVTYNQNLINKIKNNQGIDWLSRVAFKVGIAKTDSAFDGIMLKGIDSSYSYNVFKDILEAGNLPNGNLENGCIIPLQLANRLQLKVGNALPVYFNQNPPRARNFKIVGIYNLPVQGELGKFLVFCDKKHILKLNNWNTDQGSALEIHLNKTADIHHSAESINALLPPGLVAETIDQTYNQLFVWLSLFDVNKNVVLSIMLIVAGVNLITTLMVLVLERTSFIGTLGTLGATQQFIRNYFNWISMRFIAIGLIIGNLLGMSFIYLQHQFKWLKLDQTAYYIAYIPVKITLLEWASINAIMAFSCFLFTAIPAYLASKIDPLKAVKFD